MMESKQSENRKPYSHPRVFPTWYARMHAAVLCASCAAVLSARAAAAELPTNSIPGDLVLDLESGEVSPRLGRGWSVAERGGGEGYRWMNGLEADITLDVPWEGAADLWVRARPLYLPYTRQTVAVYLNDRYVSEWTCRASPDFFTHHIEVPPGFLRVGPNRMTLRTAYRKSVGRDPRLLSLCVDRILLRPR